MQGFRTARALVLDNDPEEAMPVIEALGMLGVGAVYNRGEAIDTGEKLKGIRLLFLDMVLEGFTADEPTNCVKGLVSVLTAILEDSGDPAVVVCWTENSPLKDEFEQVFRTAFPKTRVDSIKLMEKSRLKDDLPGLKREIAQALSYYGPITLLLQWEEAVHEAATATTRSITDLAWAIRDGSKSTLGESAYQVCSALALAERGTRLPEETEAIALGAFKDSLTPFLVDSLEHLPLRPSDDQIATKILATVTPAKLPKTAIGGTPAQGDGQLGASGAAVAHSADVANGQLLSAEACARLNQVLLVSFDGLQQDNYPGSIYFLQRNGENRKILKEDLFEWQEVRDETFQGYSGNIPANHFPLLIEVSTSCDFAQANAKLPRFVAGFLFPQDASQHFRSNTAYLRKIGPLRLTNADPSLNGVYYIAVNAHYLCGIRPKLARQLRPTMRLRSGVLADVIAWTAAHFSRPGYLFVDPRSPTKLGQ